VAERFELYAAGVELCNGFAELTDPLEQRARFERDLRERRALGRPLYPLDEPFLQALEAGLPPCSGNALGFDRVLMLACSAEHIADVQPFPAALV
jgi:lysyl-tRNA synthetase class 2